MRVIGSAGCADKHLSSQGATQKHYSTIAKAKPAKSRQTCMLIMTRLLVQTTCLSAARHWTMDLSRKTCHSKACPSAMTCRTSSCDAWQTSPDQNANRRGLLPATDRINPDSKHADCRCANKPCCRPCQASSAALGCEQPPPTCHAGKSYVETHRPDNRETSAAFTTSRSTRVQAVWRQKSGALLAFCRTQSMQARNANHVPMHEKG